MTSNDKPQDSLGHEAGRPEAQEDVHPTESQAARTKQARQQGKPERGTEGPAGHLDDQPQREDEYLSRVLNEFNPQRKDEKHSPTDKDTEE